MWSMNFKGAFECGNMFTTEITLINTIRYNVKLIVGISLHTSVFANFEKNMSCSLNFISVLLFTQSVYFVWAVVMGVASLSVFHSTSFNRTYFLRYQSF